MGRLEEMHMFEFVKNIFSGKNEFASSGLLLMLLGGIGVLMRAIPEKLWEWFVDQTTMMITVKDEDPAFVWVKEWFLDQAFLKRIRRLDMDITLRDESVALVPAPGRHWFWHAGRPFQVWLYRSEGTEGWSRRRTEQITFRTIGRRQTFLQEFVKAIVSCHEKREGMTSSLFIRDEYWRKVQGYTPRLLGSVILKPGEKEDLLADIEKFKLAKNRYRELGVPYHRGYVLYGPPGTGKTSLVSALAAKFGMSIYAISLTDFNDKSLMKAVHDVPPGSVILFEDIDCMKLGKARPDADERSKAKMPDGPYDKAEAVGSFGVTRSGLLNVLDGFYAPDTMLFFMTTNKIDALDRALLRPRRIDYRLFLGQAAYEQKIELYRRFFPKAPISDAIGFVEANPSSETMAEFQGLLLRMEQDPRIRANARGADQSEPLQCGDAEDPVHQDA